MIKQIKFMVLLTLSILLLLLMTACGQARRNPVFSIDENGNLIVEYENGDMQILGNVKGEENNEDEEKSITNAELNADGELILTFSDGSTVNLGNIKQEQTDETGDTETEDIRITGAEIVDGHLVLTFSNHFHVTVGKVSGSDGRKIESITITDGIWYIKYADGSEEPVTEPVFQESGSISSTIAKKSHAPRRLGSRVLRLENRRGDGQCGSDLLEHIGGRAGRRVCGNGHAERGDKNLLHPCH